MLFCKAVARGFAAILGENPIESPRVSGSNPRLPPEYGRLPEMEAVSFLDADMQSHNVAFVVVLCCRLCFFEQPTKVS
jgi:hypothetical protein